LQGGEGGIKKSKEKLNGGFNDRKISALQVEAEMNEQVIYIA